MMAENSLKRELPYFLVDGMYGFDQDRFLDPWMKLGGCGAVTACDACVYFDLYLGTRLCPFPVRKEDAPGTIPEISRCDYVRFSKLMKPHLKPRHNGINSLQLYMDGFTSFMRDIGENVISVRGLSGNTDVKQAERALRVQIDAGYPVPVLILRHADPAFEDFVWHWFLLTGYNLERDRMSVKAVSYGEWKWLDFKALWETGYEERGGMILFQKQR